MRLLVLTKQFELIEDHRQATKVTCPFFEDATESMSESKIKEEHR